MLLLTGVRPWARSPDDPPVDVLCRDGRITAIADGLDGSESAAAAEVVDGAGGVALPGFVDAHGHLDSTRLGLPFRPHTAEPSLRGLIMNDRAHWRDAGASVAARATHTLGRAIALGATLVRSHAQVDTGCGLERLHGVMAARDAHRGRAHVQIVAFPQCGILGDAGTIDLLEAALDDGADLIGGLDPAGYDRDPVSHLDVVFDLAERHRADIDIHLHDAGELGAMEIELICDRTDALGMQGHVTISHAFAVSTVDAARQSTLIERLARADVALATVAPGGRTQLPLVALRDVGVRVGLGQDGTRDYWSPYGNGDLVERAFLLAYQSAFRRDDLIELCARVATEGGANVCRRTDHRLEVGGRADIVVLRGDTTVAAIMDRLPQRLVIAAGRLVARDGELV
ncbi:MAG: amidohydrolase [Acidimicrobiales bacterium]